MNVENQYVKQFPDLLRQKKLLYVHGFGSSRQSGTVHRLRTVFTQATVIAPDLPLHPAEAMDMLNDICQKEKPDIILGTSMGGMYTEQLRGFDRICINPALCIADTMAAHGLTGTQQYQNPRQDGVQQFYVDKALVKEYRQVSEQRFATLDDSDRKRVYGLFGDRDNLVDTFDLFHSHYPQAIHFHGEHRMDDRSYMHSVMPVIRWIDDRQEHRERPVIYIGVEALAAGLDRSRPPFPQTWQQMPQPAASSQKAVRHLIEKYQVNFVAPALSADTMAHTVLSEWLREYIGVPAWGHTVFTDQRQLLLGDYMIETEETTGAMATTIAFGSPEFKTWEEIITFFDRLGGQ